MILIAELRDRALKCAIDCFDPVTEQILKPNQQRKTEVSGTGFVDDFQQIDGTATFLQRPRFDVAGAVDRKIALAPSLDVVGSNG
ncbi:MAG: hypothetical protein Udaeo_14440 [Candidatus Udaeobacter sp.]|nr:MAG: hypothetical protein Udaeo_14440 [Candidatus Udaeobacter sp.]